MRSLAPGLSVVALALSSCAAADPPARRVTVALAPAVTAATDAAPVDAGHAAPEASAPAPEASAPAAPEASAEEAAAREGPRVVNAWLAIEGQGGVRVTGPGPGGGAAPLTVLLHGMCNDPVVTCGWFRDGEIGPTWQVCPSGPVPCGWGFQWTNDRKKVAARVQGGVARARSEHGARMASERGVLVGFSQGAMVASELLPTMPGSFVGLVLVGAKVAPKAGELRAAGVRRVALAAGDFDGAAASMRRTAEALAQQGMEARYASLGKVGHFIPDATSAPVGELIEWARGE